MSKKSERGRRFEKRFVTEVLRRLEKRSPRLSRDVSISMGICMRDIFAC